MRPLFPADVLAEFLERGDEGGPRARVEAMVPDQLQVFAAGGWHCGFPRCLGPASYLSALKYATRNGREGQRGRVLCHRHARNFAARHSLDLASARPPEGGSR